MNKAGQVFAITDLSKDGNVLVLIGTLRGIFTRITTKRAIALLRTCRRETIVLICALYVFVGPLSRVRPRNGILGLVVLVVVVLPLRSEFIGEL